MIRDKLGNLGAFVSRFMYIHTPLPLWMRSIKIYPLKKSKIKSADLFPPSEIVQSFFPLRKNSNPLGNIKENKGADTATPSEMTFKGPLQKISSIEGDLGGGVPPSI